MTQFVKIVDDDGNKTYVNVAYIVSVRPEDGSNFASSGAIVTVLNGGDTRVYLVEAGASTNEILYATGIQQ